MFSPVICLLYQTHKEHGLHVYLPFLALLKLSLSLPHSATLFLQNKYEYIIPATYFCAMNMIFVATEANVISRNKEFIVISSE